MCHNPGMASGAKWGIERIVLFVAGLAGIVVAVVTVLIYLHSQPGPNPPTSTRPPTSTQPSLGHAVRYLLKMPVSEGDQPEKGIVRISGHPYMASIFYSPQTDLSTDSATTHYDLGGHWSRFTTDVGIAPDPSDAYGNGSCDRYTGPTYSVIVDGTREREGPLPCDSVRSVSVNVLHANDLELVLSTGSCFVVCTGEMAWANARLSR